MMYVNDFRTNGRLVSDPELSTTKNGSSVVKFSIAVNKYWKDGDKNNETVYFFDTESYGKIALKLKDLKKGDPISIQSELIQDRWINKDGDKKQRIFIRIFGFDKLDVSIKTENSDSMASDIPF